MALITQWTLGLGAAGPLVAFLIYTRSSDSLREMM